MDAQQQLLTLGDVSAPAYSVLKAPRQSYNYYLCSNCREKNYSMLDKVTQQSGTFLYKIYFCNACWDFNIDSSLAIRKHQRTLCDAVVADGVRAPLQLN